MDSELSSGLGAFTASHIGARPKAPKPSALNSHGIPKLYRSGAPVLKSRATDDDLERAARKHRLQQRHGAIRAGDSGRYDHNRIQINSIIL